MERNNKAAIEALLKRHGFHFSKSMGQNFLIDPAIPFEIAESSCASERNGVLEIGPGIGALSHELCERAGKTSFCTSTVMLSKHFASMSAVMAGVVML